MSSLQPAETIFVDASVYPTTRRALALGLSGKAAEALTLVLLVTVVPRILGPADYGSFMVALALVTLGSVSLSLSGPAVMSRFVATAPADERAALAAGLALRALRWRSLGLAAAAVAAAVLVVFDGNRFRPLPTALVLAAVVADAPATVAFQSALALGRTAAWSFRYPLQNLILVLGAPAFYVIAGVEGALGAIVCSSVVALLWGLALVAAPLRRVRARTRLPREVSRFAFLQGCSNLLVLVQHRGAVVAAALLAGSRTETGYAAIAVGIGVAATYAVWQLFTVTMPRFATVAAVQLEQAVTELRRLADGAVLVAAAGGIVGAALGRLLLHLLAGPQFEGAANALGPALATVPLAPLTGAVGAVTALRLRPEARLWTTAAGAAAFAVAAAALVPPLGAAGATGALLAGAAVATLAGAALFPGLVDRRLLALAFGASAIVLAVGAVR